MTTQKSERGHWSTPRGCAPDCPACNECDSCIERGAEVEKLKRQLSIAVEKLTLAKNAFEHNWAINWNELDEALIEIEKIGGEE